MEVKNAIKNNKTFVMGYISITSYYFAYKYKQGYFQYFKIPEIYLYKIDILDLILSGVGIMALMVLVLQFSSILTSNILYSSKSQIVKRIGKILPQVLILTGIAFFFKSAIIVKLILIYIGFLMVFNFIFPLFFYWKTKGYNNKLRRFFYDPNEMGFIERLNLKVQYQPFQIVILLIIVTFFVGFLVEAVGYKQAMNKSDFVVTEMSETEYVVFHINDGKVLIVELKKEYELSSQFKLIDSKEINTQVKNIKKIKIKNNQFKLDLVEPIM